MNSLMSYYLRLKGSCVSATHSDVHCYCTKDGKLYIVNTTDQPIDLAPCELFGYGPGSFDEKLAGQGLLLRKTDETTLVLKVKKHMMTKKH